MEQIEINDPPPTTPFEIVDEGGLLRLRHYAPEGGLPSTVPVLLVYSLFKRPYILDLMPERSIVRSLTRQGFSVYLTDWLPPGPDDAWRGLDAYVNGDLARAVECIRDRERVEQISLIGCCFGGLLALVYAALYPQAVRHFVPFALPLRMRPQLLPTVVEWLAHVYGNVPAWWIHATLNAGVPGPPHLAAYLAEDFGEPELARSPDGAEPAVQRALQPWLDSDVPLAGQISCEVVRDICWDGQLAESRLRVGEHRVALERIRCPVLNISAERDRIVPAASSACLIELVASSEARNLVFPTGHLGLMVSLAAHRRLWPGVGLWLRSRRERQNAMDLNAAATPPASPENRQAG